MVKTALLWLGLVLVAAAQDLKITFHTRPEGATIRLLSAQQQTKLSGLTGQPVTLQRNWLEQPWVQVEFSLPGYQTLTQQIPSQELLNQPEWPAPGRPAQPLTAETIRNLSLTLNSLPQQAQIYLANSSSGKGHYLGLTGTRLSLDKSLVDGPNVFLRLEKEGYEPFKLNLLGGEFVEGAVLPADGPVRLRQTWPGWLHQWSRPLAGLLLCLAAGLAFWLRRQPRTDWKAPQADPLGTPSPHAQALAALGYQLGDELGRGGMAVVYNATRQGSDTALALKLLHREVGLDQDAINRMRREIKVMRELTHPAIVPLYDFGDVNGQYYLVMEKVEGQSLKKRLEQGRISQEQAIRFIHMLLQGVAYAHNKDIVHRDLKPDNVMLRSDGRLQILDFGISRSTTANTFETMDNSVLGTPAYMAPERFSGVANKASDQYALGLIFYELLCGVAPVPNNIDVAQIITRQLFEVPPEPSSVDGDVPKTLDYLVMTMIAKDPVKRFPSLDAALEQFYRAFPSLQPVATPTLPERPKPSF